MEDLKIQLELTVYEAKLLHKMISNSMVIIDDQKMAWELRERLINLINNAQKA